MQIWRCEWVQNRSTYRKRNTNNVLKLKRSRMKLPTPDVHYYYTWRCDATRVWLDFGIRVLWCRLALAHFVAALLPTVDFPCVSCFELLQQGTVLLRRWRWVKTRRKSTILTSRRFSLLFPTRVIVNNVNSSPNIITALCTASPSQVKTKEVPCRISEMKMKKARKRGWCCEIVS